MGDEKFNETILTEKLSKLNSSQQSIESLSKWCVTHRNKAKQVIENWDKVFKAAERGKQVSLLYLANDILQNSRRKGSEFVNEFWKVLPPALKGAYDSGHQSSRKVVLRLVNIWEERKVFGSRGHNLKNKIQGEKEKPSPAKKPAPVNNVKKPNPIKIVKRDADSLRIKLDVGCVPEKILTAFQLVFDENFTEEGAITKCKETVSSIQELEKDVAKASSQGDQVAPDVVEDIQKQETMLQQCINQLENAEAIRAALVSQLKEALGDQESKLELIRNELHVARGRVDQASNTRPQLPPSSTPPTTNLPTTNHTFPPGFSPPNPSLTQPTHLSTSSMNEEATTKATAAAMAEKLASSTSSAQMLSSILSSLLSEPEVSNSANISTSQQSVTTFPPVPTNQLQAQFYPPPPPPPLPANPPGYQVPANSQGYQVGMQYNYGGANSPGQYPPAQQAGPGNGGYYRPVGTGFYGQTHQPSTSPVDRQ